MKNRSKNDLQKLEQAIGNFLKGAPNQKGGKNHVKVGLETL